MTVPKLLVVLLLIAAFGIGLVITAMGTAIAIERQCHRAAWWWLAGSLVCLSGLLVLAITMPPGTGDATGGGWR